MTAKSFQLSGRYGRSGLNIFLHPLAASGRSLDSWIMLSKFSTMPSSVKRSSDASSLSGGARARRRGATSIGDGDGGGEAARRRGGGAVAGHAQTVITTRIFGFPSSLTPTSSSLASSGPAGGPAAPRLATSCGYGPLLLILRMRKS